MIIRARAPLRLGLAGGGTDVDPYCSKYGGCVLNATIDRYAYAVIKSRGDEKVTFTAADKSEEVSCFASTNLELDGRLDLHKAAYNYMVKNYNNGCPISIDLCTFCDAEPGSGLGSSSTLVVVMVRAFAELFNLPLDDYQIASIAHHIERTECGLQGGKQDQYAATFGGFNFMEFSGDRVLVNPLRIKNWILCELEASLLLFYTGQSRDSAKIIADQSSNVSSNNNQAIEAMHKVKEQAIVMKECILKGDFKGIVDSMSEGWESKKLSSSSISNSLIEEIYNSAISAGALAGKVSGAGGGGYMMFYVAPDMRINVINKLSQFEGMVSNCHFTESGTQAWTIF